MERTLLRLPAWRPLRWALYALGIMVAVLNAWEVVRWIEFWQVSGGQQDWQNLLVDPADPYRDNGYIWSPLAAWPLQVLPLIGFWGWTALKAATLLLLPWRIGLIVFATLPFWSDAMTGNAVVPIFVLAWLAVAGSRWGTWAFFIVAMLIPRPLMLPLLGWLLWNRPELRLPFAVLASVMAVLTLATGQVDEWIAQVQWISAWEVTRDGNLLPSRWIGGWWALGALPLSAVLAWRGHLGLAAVAASVYKGYFLFLLLEARERNAPSASSQVASVVSNT